MSMTITIPIRTTNPLNGSHGHWRVRAARARDERAATAAALAPYRHPALPVVVTLTRISPGTLDDDAVPGSMKHARDQIAVWLGLPTNKRGHAEDRDERVTWRYSQRRGGRGEYAVEVLVEERT